MKKLLGILNYIWAWCLLFSFSIVSVWIYGSIIGYMRENAMPDWAIGFTGTVLAVTTIVIMIRVALFKYKIFKGGLKEENK